MKRLKVVVASLIALSAPLAAKEKPPTISFDPYRKTGTITGESHWHNALLDLDKSQWFFQLAIVDGVPHNPVLMYSTDTTEWFFFNHAADVDGHEFKVIEGPRDVYAGNSVHELVGIEMTAEYVRQHRLTGMNIKVMGQRGDKVLQIPAEAVSTFADGAISIFRNLAASSETKAH